MREYKFRGKKADAEEWLYGSLLKDIPQKKYYIVDNEDGSGIGVSEKTIGQYIGLKDKNGKEIYEGDIVKVKHLNAIYVGTVKFDEEYCEYRIELVDAYINLWKKLKDIEIIGNATDNLELLKEG